MSGFRLEYDLTRRTGERLRSVLVPCQTDCGDGPELEELVELEDDQVYSVVMTDYLAGGGDGFNVIKDKKDRQLQGPLDTDIFKEYMKVMQPIETTVEGRISIVTSKHRESPVVSGGGGTVAVLCHHALLLLLLSLTLGPQ